MMSWPRPAAGARAEPTEGLGTRVGTGQVRSGQVRSVTGQRLRPIGDVPPRSERPRTANGPNAGICDSPARCLGVMSRAVDSDSS